jgi:gliding motility-associated-like protein
MLSVTASFSNGCTATAQHLLRMPTVHIATSGSICAPGESQRLLAVAPGATSYSWSTGATTADLNVTQPGTYHVTATFANGCTRTAAYTATREVAHIVGDTLICPGQSLTLSARLGTNDSPVSTAHWNTGSTGASISINRPGTYTVAIPYGNTNCQAQGQLQVRAAAAAPSFSLGSDTVICENDELLLRAPAVAVPGPVSYRWSDGSTSTTLRVQQAGDYSLSITTVCGTTSATRRIERRNCALIPNIITPNHDQVNDVFAPQNLPTGTWSLELYNRWGRRVYSTANYQNNWGTEAASGLYFYRLQLVGSTRSFQGWLEVVR